MRLSVNTELGEFKFNLSQAGVIYMLGLLQKIEDEGDAAIRPEVMTPVDIEEEQAVIPEAIESDPEPEQEESFEDLLAQEEARLQAELPGQPVKGKYKGFLYIKCDGCGKTKGFCAKQPTDEYKCSQCGHRTKLGDLRRMFLDCECGAHFKYYTNETAEVITANCLECGSPVDMMLNSRRTTYVSLGGGTQRKSSGISRISTTKHRW